jgi:predicted AlkP superfamily phosphohydrolase/phosphomutase
MRRGIGNGNGLHHLLAAALLLGLPAIAPAYIGPGAGFAFISSFLVLFAAIGMAILTLLTFPIRWLWRLVFRKNPYKKARTKRVVILGLDGLDPTLARRFMDEGMLPNFKKLADEGTFSPLRTTFPSISPVAWSSFSTGGNPARHNIFDFLSRDPKTYLPDLSSARVGTTKRVLRLGPIEIPLGEKPLIEGFRRGKSFWTVLGEHGIISQVIRVPITFPPEKFKGMMLSAMCVPDLRGTQGTFTLYTTDETRVTGVTGGVFVKVEREGDLIRGELIGPDLGGDGKGGLSGGDLGGGVGPEEGVKKDTALKVPFTLRLKDNEHGELELPGEKVELTRGEYSDWLSVSFKVGFGKKVRGIALFMLTRTEPHVELYVTPIQIDPLKPALPISHPTFYSIYLGKLLGPYATLGLAEDTWGLEEGAIDDDAFLAQTYLFHAEREKMFFNAVEKTKRGVVVCVFDATDRIQHTFWRYREDGRPALRDSASQKHIEAIEELYRRMDGLLGRLRSKLDDDTVLIVMSDHGFKPFNIGVQLNTWLLRNGYLALKPGVSEGKADWFADVDWSRTRAYAFGLAGIYLNLKDREEQGIVEPGEEYQNLKAELVKRLSGLEDPATGKVAIVEVFDTEQIYRGPYKTNAPDLLTGYNIGYRASWDSVTGKVGGEVFQPNEKAWSGDHCLDPRLVPGVFFCNRKTGRDNPHITDIGPTVLDLFGVEVPPFMDGKPLLEPEATRPGERGK